MTDGGSVALVDRWGAHLPAPGRFAAQTCGCQEPHPCHATRRYSWMRPPSRSVRRSRKLAGDSLDIDGGVIDSGGI